MLFNSIEFLLFLITVFFLYWFIFGKSLKGQNILLLACSYLFYAWWDWRFLGLLLLSTLIDYFFGKLIATSLRHKKLFLVLSIINNLGILFFFKYFNFFSESFAVLLGKFGFAVNPVFIHFALPVGISFYTFHGMSYVFDIYRGKVKPENNFVSYAVFVCFFPLLVAGPIERAGHLLPQINTKRNFSYAQAVEGMRLMLWGFFKKVVIADTLAKPVNHVFTGYAHYDGATFVLVAVYFAIQIYCDFSGYSDIAIGVAKLLGIELFSNFRFPYFSRDIAEFWRRWHISLTSWFRDYVYIPLGGSKQGSVKAIRNTCIIFLVSAFWHGANWTFIAWGAIHALLFMPLLLLGKNRKHTQGVVAPEKIFPSAREFFQMGFTFLMVTIAWIFFRSATIGDAWNFIAEIPHRFWRLPSEMEFLPYVLVLLAGDWLQRRDERRVLNIQNKSLRYLTYFVLTMLVVLHFSFIDKNQFIYFQF